MQGTARGAYARRKTRAAAAGAVLLLLLLLPPGAGQAEGELWVRQFGTGGWRTVVSVDRVGNVYVSGFTDRPLTAAPSAGSFDAYVRAYDAAGTERWTRQFGTDGWDAAEAATTDAAGDVYVVGVLARPFPRRAGRAFVRKYDGAGTERWTREVDGPGLDVARGAAADAEGNVYIAGITDTAAEDKGAALNPDVFLRSYDADGNLRWSRTFGTPRQEEVAGVGVDEHANVYVGGVTWGALPGHASGGGSDSFLRKYDSGGRELWTRQFGGEALDDVWGLAVDASGTAYLPGQEVVGESVRRTVLHRFDPDGNPAPALAVPGRPAVAAGRDGAVHVAVADHSAGRADVLAAMYSSSGEMLSSRRFGSPGTDSVDSVAVDARGNVYVGGNTDGVFPDERAGAGNAFVARMAARAAAPPETPPAPRLTGAWLGSADGEVVALGDAPSLGQPAAPPGEGHEVAALVPTGSGRGYWVVTDAGEVAAFGDAAALDGTAHRDGGERIVAAAVALTSRSG